MAKAKDSLLDIPVQFGKVSIGANTASIPLKCDRASLSVSKADKHMCGHRLSGVILASDSQPDQGHFPGMDGATGELEAVFDVKGFAVKPKHLSFGLSLSIKDVDMSGLAHFANRQGRFIIYSAEAIPDDEGGDEGDDD
jgi:hypothetical protein